MIFLTFVEVVFSHLDPDKRGAQGWSGSGSIFKLNEWVSGARLSHFFKTKYIKRSPLLFYSRFWKYFFICVWNSALHSQQARNSNTFFCWPLLGILGRWSSLMHLGHQWGWHTLEYCDHINNLTQHGEYSCQCQPNGLQFIMTLLRLGDLPMG